MSEDTPRLTEAHIESLELKMMDLENTVNQLNEVILRQYKDIERLQLQQEDLLKRLSGAASGDSPSPADEVPPHY